MKSLTLDRHFAEFGAIWIEDLLASAGQRSVICRFSLTEIAVWGRVGIAGAEPGWVVASNAMRRSRKGPPVLLERGDSEVIAGGYADILLECPGKQVLQSKHDCVCGRIRG